MKTNTGNRASPDWRGLYEVAVLESDPAKLPKRINDAQHAIMGRVEDLKGSEDSLERATLAGDHLREIVAAMSPT